MSFGGAVEAVIENMMSKVDEDGILPNMPLDCDDNGGDDGKDDDVDDDNDGDDQDDEDDAGIDPTSSGTHEAAGLGKDSSDKHQHQIKLMMMITMMTMMTMITMTTMIKDSSDKHQHPITIRMMIANLIMMMINVIMKMLKNKSVLDNLTPEDDKDTVKNKTITAILKKYMVMILEDCAHLSSVTKWSTRRT